MPRGQTSDKPPLFSTLILSVVNLVFPKTPPSALATKLATYVVGRGDWQPHESVQAIAGR